MTKSLGFKDSPRDQKVQRTPDKDIASSLHNAKQIKKKAIEHIEISKIQSMEIELTSETQKKPTYKESCSFLLQTY